MAALKESIAAGFTLAAMLSPGIANSRMTNFQDNNYLTIWLLDTILALCNYIERGKCGGQDNRAVPSKAS